MEQQCVTGDVPCPRHRQDTPATFWLAFCATILLGIMNEGLIKLRRGPCAATQTGRRSRAVGVLTTTVLFALQTTLGERKTPY